MEIALMLLLCWLCFELLGLGMWKHGRTLTFAFMAGGVYLAFVVPQLLGLIGDPKLPPGGLTQTVAMAALCALGIYLGQLAGHRPIHTMDWNLDPRWLLFSSGLFTVVGAYFFWRISLLDPEMTSVAWRGTPVVFNFFAGLLVYGFAIAVYLVARYRSTPAMWIVAVCSVFYFHRIVIAARRQAALEFIVIILCMWLFNRRKAIPRFFYLAMIPIGALVMFSTSQYRALGSAGVRDWSTVSNIDTTANLEATLEGGGSELRAAAYSIEARSMAGGYDFGLVHWNVLVQNFVPSGVVGESVKRSLIVELGPDEKEVLGYEKGTGSTRTGFAVSYSSFWFFGCLEFALIAYLLNRLFVSAEQGHAVAQLLFALSVVPGLLSITHGTYRFVCVWPHIALFVLPVFYLAKIGPRQRALTGHPQPVAPPDGA
ncbi:MAG: hypothetical protein AB7K09_08820 [Planctomycetota bacterium]